MQHYLLMVFLVAISFLLTSCIKECIYEPEIEYRDVLIEKPVEVIRYVNTTMPDGVECNCTANNETPANLNNLIRRLKFYENRESLWINYSNVNESLERLRKNITDCREELCNQNRSWC